MEPRDHGLEPQANVRPRPGLRRTAAGRMRLKALRDSLNAAHQHPQQPTDDPRGCRISLAAKSQTSVRGLVGRPGSGPRLAACACPWQSHPMADIPTAEPSAAPRISFVSLGCPKALVDSERILTRLRAEGYELSRSHAGADAVIVNTCGFLDSAKAESLAAIGQAMKENGRVIVTGCMGAEPDAIRDAFPNLSAITGPQAFESVMEAVHVAAPAPHDPFVDLIPEGGVRLTPRHYAYLKISEGCATAVPSASSRNCVAISSRGPRARCCARRKSWSRPGSRSSSSSPRTRAPTDSTSDMRQAPGMTGKSRRAFLDLTRELGLLGAWIRLHYVYPYPHVDQVVELMNGGAVLPYIDVPFQHASPRVFKAMRRPGNQEKTLERIRAWRAICPDLTIRSTFIVGFPGETDEDFRLLLDWLDEAKLDRVGAFKYEPVKGARLTISASSPCPTR